MTLGIAAPFFEIGPKTFLSRAALLEVTAAAARAARRFDVDVILTPPALDIEIVKAAAPDIWVFAQAMDLDRPGPSTGAVTAEALRAAGADGVMLNHAERPLSGAELAAAMARAAAAGLATMVCVEGVDEARRAAQHQPDIVLAEPHYLIGSAHRAERPWIPLINAAVADVSPGTLVMHSGGIADEADIAAVIGQGAAGTGCTTAVVAATDRPSAVTALIRAVRESWDARATELESERTSISR
jgi:triosephosphate isomerase